MEKEVQGDGHTVIWEFSRFIISVQIRSELKNGRNLLV